MRTALITCGGGFQGLGLLEALQQVPGVRSIVADVHYDNVTRYLADSYRVFPPVADRHAFSAALLELVEREHIDSIFPATARELPLLAGLCEKLLAVGATTCVSTPALIAIFLDKARNASFLHERGLPAHMPVDPSAHDFTTGLFGKPKSGWGGLGTVIARSFQDTVRAESARPSESLVWFPLLQKFEEYSSDFAIAPGQHLSPIILRRRLRTSGGFAVISESVADPELLDVAHKTARSLAEAGACGIFNVQLLQPDDGPIVISDLNPRFGTSAVHGLWEGVNLPGFFMGRQGVASDGTCHDRRAIRTIRYLKTMALPKLDTRPRGIVFDLDDTLVDHKLWMAEKALTAFRATANAWPNCQDFERCLLQLIDEGERSHLIDRLAELCSWSEHHRQAFLAAYRSARVVHTPLFPDVAPVLASLRQAGFELAILTDNPPATQRAKILGAPALERIQTVVFSRDNGGEKPARAAFSLAASAMHLAPAELCMVGDNYFRDGLGAVRAGYSSAIVVRRAGAFLQPHPLLSTLLRDTAGCERIHRIDDLHCLRETMLDS